MNVLIVDDSKAMRCIIARALREMGVPGAPYLEAPNGKAALETIAAADPELVISDFNMPEMNGMELLQTLRRDGLETAFGFVTSEASPQLQQEATEAGATFLVTKPFTAAHLSLTLGPVLARLGCRTLGVESDMEEASLDTNSGFPSAAQIGAALGELLRRNVSATAGHPVVMPPNVRQVAEYLSLEDGRLVGCCVCDVAFAARAGAAITLIPAAVAEEAIRARRVEDVVAENFREVLNVMTRFSQHRCKSRLKVGPLHPPGEKLSAELSTLLARPAARLDLTVKIAGYGDGIVSLLCLTPGKN